MAARMTDHVPDDLDAEALIELYFELEDDDEREVVLEKLEVMDSPMVREFWRAAAHEDDDELVQVRANTYLAKRADADALAALKATIADPDDLVVFEEALHAVATVEGAAFFPTLEALWRDASRDADERRTAMTVMELVDNARALASFDAWIGTLGDVEAFPDDQVELVLLAYLRAEHAAAIPLLEALLARLTESSRDMDDDERDELLGMVREGIELLRTPAELRA
jgi:hypothetical protein